MGGLERTSKDLNTLITKIYDAALDPELWNDFLLAVSDAVKGSATVFIANYSRDPSANLLRISRFPPELLQLYEDQYFLEGDLWHQLVQQHCQSGDIFIGSELISDQELRKTPMYHDLFKPGDAGYLLCSVIEKHQPMGATLSVSRSMRKKDFSHEEKQLFELLTPHLRRAFLLHRRFLELQEATSSAQEALQHSPSGIALLDDHGQILFMNDRAEQIIRQADGMTCIQKKFSFANPRHSQRFEQLIGEATLTAQHRGLYPGGAMRVGRPSNKSPYLLMVTPLNLRSEHRQVAPDAAVCVFLQDSAENMPLSEPLLCALYGFTPAEARVAQGLFAGLSPKEVAHQQHLKISTIRTHLRRIFEKTQTSNQAQLIRHLARGPGMIAASTDDCTEP